WIRQSTYPKAQLMSHREGSVSARPGRAFVSSLGALGLMTLGENRVFDRLLFLDRPEYEFVLLNVRGVLEGTPVSRSFQHRLFAPMLVRAVESVTASPLAA